MGLIVEDGSKVPDADSYVSVQDADTYHGNHGNDAWAGLTQTQKEVALRKATAYLDGHYYTRFKGRKVDYLHQSLEWPRYDVNLAGPTVYAGAGPGPYVGEGYGFYNILDYKTIPQRLKDATCEAAIRAATGELAADVEAGVKTKNIAGAIVTTYDTDSGAVKQKYRVIDYLLKPFLNSGRDVVRG